MKYEEIRKIIEQLLNYLSKENKNGKFPARTFYGETFTALSMLMYDKKKYNKEIEEIMEYYLNKKDKSVKDFHWEFNNYALFKIYEIENKLEYKENLFPLKFKGTNCSNWTMLRGLVKVITGKKEGLKEIRNKIKKNQLENGLIKDDKKVNSFQYHSFMLFLLIEAYEVTQKEWLLNSFIKGINFIYNITLANGDNSYIGRGQEQIFGYGPLLYSLEKAFIYTNDKKYKYLQKNVFIYLKKFIKKDGSIPLVLRASEKKYPFKININDINYLGWYGYNNYFDYLPFLTYFFVLLEQIFNEVEIEDENIDNKKDYYDGMYYIKRENVNYEAALAVPDYNGYLTNDMSFPYIIMGDKRITPMYGGEEYGSSLYSLEGIPLPNLFLNLNLREKIKEALYQLIFFKKISFLDRLKKILKIILKRNKKEEKYYFKNRLIYSLDFKGSFIGEGYFFKHRRDIEFKKNCIEIKETIISKDNLKIKEFKILNIFSLGSLQKKSKKEINSLINNKNISFEFKGLKEVRIDNKKYYCAIDEVTNISCYMEKDNLKKGEKIIFSYKINLNERI
ncbi:hypothetical protein EV215_1882 [Hypnocyclicus thermotrophus]|uniref:Uncharacterized protein n=1 Tax=Hypnocyclicus thermotrophus TaxID=1627895 RepID=A0AA46I501_9FUSO|nr:hypothetical protein [Hypnocyclicus thermotrophus]TDT67878.1 hypothetical protein EV215_1882 [Hypnocyclicus thermotrophus]